MKDKERLALITGSSRGIGAACAEKLHSQGYKIALHCRKPSEASSIMKEKLFGSELFTYDISSFAECQKLIKEIKERFGRIDVLVNNAGIAIDQVITFAKPDDFELILNTNLKSVFWMTKQASRLMVRQKSGAIINLSSVVGHTGNPGQSMYAATKAGVTGFTRAVAQDLAPFKIRCNCVAPGYIETDMTSSLEGANKEAFISRIPLRRAGRASEVADAVAFLASDSASYITGSTIHVNGGMFNA